MSDALFPYDVFKVDTPNSNDPELGAYQLPNGEVRVLTNNLGQSEIHFESKNKADAFLSEIKGRIKGEIVGLNPQDYGKILTSDISFEEKSIEVSTSQSRAEKTQSTTETSTPNEKVGQNETKQQDRLETKSSDNNRPENLGENTIDDAPNQNNLIRAGRSEPESSGNGESIGDRIQNEVTDFFDNGQRASSTLKGQLEDYVLEGGDPILGALGATGLDALDLAMSFTKNNALGILDIRNLGEGVQKGTWEGVREDLGRAVNILPAGKVVKMASAVLTGADLKEAGEQIVEAASQGDSKTAITTVASIGLGFLISKIKRKKQQSWRDSERDTGDFLEVHFKKGEWSSQTKFKDGSLLKGSKRNPKDSTVPDFHNEDMKVAVESKRYSDVFKRKDKQRLLEQAGGRLISLPNGTKQWLFIDHRGMNLSEKSTMKIYKDYYRSFGGNSVFEKFFIVTEKGIFMF